LKFLLAFLFSVVTLFASDATIEIVKKVDSLPSLAIEDSSTVDDGTFRMKFFKMLSSDLNVLSIFNVEKRYATVSFDASSVLVENKDINYVLRYKIEDAIGGKYNIYVKMISKDEVVFSKKYELNSQKIFMFSAHAIAYDINEFMGEDSVEWIKRRVIFSKLVSAHNSQLVISDYTLSYQHVIVSGGFNVFPKWANKEQNAFYYTSLDGATPVLKHLDLKSSKITNIKAVDGMIICSDVSEDGSKLLLSMAPTGQPDVYEYDVKSKKYKQLTSFGGIDVNAQYMSDGKIAFVSDRMGNPNIFSLNPKTGSVEQMVYYGKNNSTCSTHGNYLVYKSRESSELFDQNTFNLHLMSTKTDAIRRLTAVGVNEFPRFSIDGDAIIFIKNYQTQSSIGVIRVHHNKNFLFPLAKGKIQSLDW